MKHPATLLLTLLLTAMPAAAQVATPSQSTATRASSALQSAQQKAYDLLNNRTTQGTSPGCYTAEARQAFREAIDTAANSSAVTRATNTYKQSVIRPTASTADATDEHWYYIVSGPSVSYSEDARIYDATTQAGEQITWTDPMPGSASMWKLVTADEAKGTFTLVNRATGRAMQTTGGSGSAVTSADAAEGTLFTLTTLGEQRAFIFQETRKYPVHADSHGVIVTWNATTLNTASAWHFDPVLPSQIEAADAEITHELIWSDEFNYQGAPSASDWNYESGFCRNEEPQWYQQANAECNGTDLVITARKEQVANTNYDASSSDWKKNRQYASYTSASLNTSGKHEMLYGRIEVRAKIPTSPGAWPAIWTLGHSGWWPGSGEIDVLEFYNNSIFANLCWGDGTDWGQVWRSVKTPFSHFTENDPQWAEKYHTWTLDRDTVSVRIYLDGELLNCTSLNRTRQPQTGSCGSTNAFRTNHYLLLNLALSSPQGDTIDESAFPLRYYIDYVRFYKTVRQATGISQANTTDDTTTPWYTITSSTVSVSPAAFASTPTLTLTDLTGRTVAQASHATTISRPATPGMLILTATDGHTTRTGKIVALRAN